MERTEYKKMFVLEERHFWFVAKRLFIRTILERFEVKVKRVADLGCGTGGLMKEMEKESSEVVGVDLSEEAVKLARKRGVSVSVARIEKTGLASSSFDLVLITDVLYHEGIEIDKAIEEAKRILKNGGQLLITDSAMKILSGGHDEIYGGTRRFSRQELIGLLKKHGFEIRYASYLFMWLFPIIYIKRKKLKKKISVSDLTMLPNWINMTALMIMKLESLFLKRYLLPFGSSVLVLGRKP